MKSKVDIADLDCIYLSYDEPQKEEFWVRIRNMVPWAKRVDGIKGSARQRPGRAGDNRRGAAARVGGGVAGGRHAARPSGFAHERRGRH